MVIPNFLTMYSIVILIVCCLICVIISGVTTTKVKKSLRETKFHEEETLKYKREKAQILIEVNSLISQRQQIEQEINMLEETSRRLQVIADESAEAYHKQRLETIELQLEKELQQEEKKFQQAKKEYMADYEQVMNDMAESAAKYGTTAKQLLKTIEDLKSKVQAAMEAEKRNMKEHDAIEFHRIQISDVDLLEIEKLREILPFLRDKDTLNKVIYKIYYENPVNDLIGRVIGKKQGGIYKITNIKNGMCYVGQAVNFANRWKQHIKRGVGAEPITHNKLYPAMQKEGVENFTFEIIEECSSDKLNEREAYWQDYFGAKEFGYSIR